MDSFRAEACGLIAGTCLLRLLAKQHHAAISSTIHTNSASLLARLLRATAEHMPTGFWLKPDSDIIMQLVEELKTLPEMKRHCVKGHQDATKKHKELTLPETHNTAADAEATIMLFEMRQPASHVIPFPASIVNVSVGKQQINSALNTLLHEELTREGCWQCLESKFHWTPTTRKLIAWDLFRKLPNNQHHKPHQQLIKRSVGWLPTGCEVHRHDSLEEHRCPHCKTEPEKNAHLLRCPHPDRVSKRNQFLSTTMNNFQHTSNTAQPIRELISQSLLQWFRNPAIAHRFSCTHPLFRASTHQQAIGWQHFLHGRMATAIIEHQEKCCRDRDSPANDTGQAWAKKLIHKLWGHFHEVWQFRCDERHKPDQSKVSKQRTFRVHG
jgi:hypothetical protein